MPKKLQKSSSTNKATNKIVLLLLVLGVLIASVGVGSYFFKVQQSKNTTTNQDSSNLEDIKGDKSQKVVEMLQKVLLVDENAIPAVAEVTDSNKLKASQPDFYKDIIEGDFLIIYPDKAIIYRAGENKIINVSPIVKSDGQNLETKEVENPTATKIEK